MAKCNTLVVAINCENSSTRTMTTRNDNERHDHNRQRIPTLLR